jgi:hypothetical protein
MKVGILAGGLGTRLAVETEIKPQWTARRGVEQLYEVYKRVGLTLEESEGERFMRIAAYGAAAKGATLINYVDIGTELVDFVVDRNSFKQGRYMPGRHLPIFGPEKLLEEMPDFVLLLAWNFADEIRARQSEYESRGGRFIVPVPEPRVLGG